MIEWLTLSLFQEASVAAERERGGGTSEREKEERRWGFVDYCSAFIFYTEWDGSFQQYSDMIQDFIVAGSLWLLVEKKTESGQA